ncbi:MAG: 7-carboxy-7-deazaguanine synthase QueE, partial [Verrucomicrobiota bacterium]
MLISEIFYSLQGEGELVGVPSVFIRTSGCNLRCRWCDTPYASWNPEGDEMTIETIIAEVQKHPAAHVVLTGGEPMVARGIHELAARLRDLGKHITIETAGTIAPVGIACDLASISPKLSNSTPAGGSIEPAWIERHEKSRLRLDILREWLATYPFQLKFVVSSESDLAEIQSLIASTGLQIPPSKILLMPEGIDPAALDSRRSMLIDFCLLNGHRF